MLNGYRLNSSNFASAIATKDVDFVRKVHLLGCPFDEDCMISAINTKSLEMVKLIAKLGNAKCRNCGNFSEEVFLTAIRVKNFEILEWVLNKLKRSYSSPCHYAARLGDIETFVWMKKTGYYTEDSFGEALQAGQLKFLDFLLEEEGRPEGDVYGHAIFCKDLTALNWVYEHEFQWDEMSFFDAVSENKLEVLNWAHEKKYPFWSVDHTQIAAHAGNLEALKWLRSIDCPWDSDVCKNAIEYRHCELLKWARSENCPWHDNYFTINKLYPEEIETIKWALLDGCPGSWMMAFRAIGDRNFDFLFWIISNGFHWRREFCINYAQGFGINLIEWLKSVGLE